MYHENLKVNSTDYNVIQISSGIMIKIIVSGKTGMNIRCVCEKITNPATFFKLLLRYC